MKEDASLQRIIDSAIEQADLKGVAKKSEEIHDMVFPVVDREEWTYDRVLSAYIYSRIRNRLNIKKLYSIGDGMYVDPTKIKNLDSLKHIVDEFGVRITGNGSTQKWVQETYNNLLPEYGNQYEYDGDSSYTLPMSREEFIAYLEASNG